MRDQKIQIDVKRRAPESYAQMKERQQREANGFPLAFAFSDRQFAQGMRGLGLDPSATQGGWEQGAGTPAPREDKGESLERWER